MPNNSYENDFDLHEKETAYRTHMKGFALRLACVASVSVDQRAKNELFGVLPARKMGRKQNKKEGSGRGEGKKRLHINP